MRQIGLLFYYLDDFIFLADDDEPTERVWADEKTAIAELAAEGWEVTSGPAASNLIFPGWQDGTSLATGWNAAFNNSVSGLPCPRWTDSQ